MQHAVATRDAAIAASITSRPALIKKPVGRPKAQLPLGFHTLPGEKHVWAELQLRWSAGELLRFISEVLHTIGKQMRWRANGV